VPTRPQEAPSAKIESKDMSWKQLGPIQQNGNKMAMGLDGRPFDIQTAP
jgi:hypothetical protein